MALQQRRTMAAGMGGHSPPYSNCDSDDHSSNHSYGYDGLTPGGTALLIVLFAGFFLGRSFGPCGRVATTGPSGRGPQDDNHSHSNS